MNNKIKCSKCDSKMELIGVTDKGAWKYHCKYCYTIIEVFKNA